MILHLAMKLFSFASYCLTTNHLPCHCAIVSYYQLVEEEEEVKYVVIRENINYFDKVENIFAHSRIFIREFVTISGNNLGTSGIISKHKAKLINKIL